MVFPDARGYVSPPEGRGWVSLPISTSPNFHHKQQLPMMEVRGSSEGQPSDPPTGARLKQRELSLKRLKKAIKIVQHISSGDWTNKPKTETASISKPYILRNSRDFNQKLSFNTHFITGYASRKWPRCFTSLCSQEEKDKTAKINSEEKSNLRSEAESGTSVFRSHLESVQSQFLGVLIVRRDVLGRGVHVGMKLDDETFVHPNLLTVEEVDEDLEDLSFVVTEEPVFFWALVHKSRPPGAAVPCPYDVIPLHRP